jgi:hypothetical protein
MLGDQSSAGSRRAIQRRPDGSPQDLIRKSESGSSSPAGSQYTRVLRTGNIDRDAVPPFLFGNENQQERGVGLC